jgi:hypothetical protein
VIVPDPGAPGKRKPALLTWHRQPHLLYSAAYPSLSRGDDMQLQVRELKGRIARLEGLGGLRRK